MTVIYNMSIDRADKPWIGDRRLTESTGLNGVRKLVLLQISGARVRQYSKPWSGAEALFAAV